MNRTIPILLVIVFSLLTRVADADSLADKFLAEGKLKAGEAAIQKHLQSHPNDDENRLGLGVIRFLLAFEHLGTSLYHHGLRADRIYWLLDDLDDFLPPPKKEAASIDYQQIRTIVQTFVDDLDKVDKTFAKIKNPDVKFIFKLREAKVDLFGIGKPLSAKMLLGMSVDQDTRDLVERMEIVFDRGDVEWFRGYCHFFSGVAEIVLAVDGKEMHERTGHLLFTKPVTPHKFLLEEKMYSDFEYDDGWSEEQSQSYSRWITDIISYIHLMRFPMKEPKRMRASLEHFEKMVEHSRKMWTFYLKETDDDREWIPNPKQTGVLNVKVSQKMVDEWLKSVDEIELLLQGKKLIPFWRGKNPRRGLNLRQVFTKPKIIDPILWIQGTAATPYLEEGEITEFADPRRLLELSETFGGFDFFGFAFWFN